VKKFWSDPAKMPSKQSHPYLSFVMVGRNDNYGGDFNTRLELCIKIIVSYAQKYELNAEIILVEWNPISNKSSLRDMIPWPEENEFVSIRIITVLSGIHHTFENSEDILLFEYQAKNVGIRRVNGEFVLIRIWI
jgi:2,4-dienoyl-CoA reductase-like NADH-dependent reductase (Old Yellow Enzyme family)